MQDFSGDREVEELFKGIIVMVTNETIFQAEAGVSRDESPEQVAGIALAALFLVALLSAFAYLLRRRKCIGKKSSQCSSLDVC